MLVAMGLRPSLHAAARQADDLPVSLAALYDKVRRTEPEVLRALVRRSAERLAPVLSAIEARPPSLPGFALRVLDGNHLLSQPEAPEGPAGAPGRVAAWAGAGGLRPQQRPRH